ncbi:MAG: HAD family hydrolase [Bacteroidales bacterium]
MDYTNIKGVIFDYGGTIDSRGDHWSEIIWDGYKLNNIAITKEQFREAYVYAERELARVKHIFPEDDFYKLLLVKMHLELGCLAEKGLIEGVNVEQLAVKIATYCNQQAINSVEQARPVIEQLSKLFPLVLVSNFYGNVEAVLKAYDLRRYFQTIVESAVVGVRKPDPAIFQLGVDALSLDANEVLVIGDSYKKDIVPARSIGCQVMWLKGKGWSADEDAQIDTSIIKSLNQVLQLIRI